MPKLKIKNLSEFKSKQLLIDLHCSLDYMVGREVFFDFLLVNAVKLFFKDVGVETFIPSFKFSLLILGLISLQLLKSQEFLTSCFLKFVDQTLFKVLDIHRFFLPFFLQERIQSSLNIQEAKQFHVSWRLDPRALGYSQRYILNRMP